MHHNCRFIGFMVLPVSLDPKELMLQLRVEGNVTVCYLCEIRLPDVETETGLSTSYFILSLRVYLTSHRDTSKHNGSSVLIFEISFSFLELH